MAHMIYIIPAVLWWWSLTSNGCCMLHYIALHCTASWLQEERVQSLRLERRRGQLVQAAKREMEAVRGRLRSEAAEERVEMRWASVCGGGGGGGLMHG